MIESSEAYRSAVMGDARRVYIRAIVKIFDPDIVYATPTGSPQAEYSAPEQLHDHNFDENDNFQTFELNRIILDKSSQLLRDGETVTQQVGYITDALSNADGIFSSPQVITQGFSNVDVLQSVSVRFPGTAIDGVARDFTISIMSGSTAAKTFSIAENDSAMVRVDDFTVENPTAISVSITRWSLPYRRARVIEIFPGIYEEWKNRDVAALTVRQQANFTSLALPYGRCTLTVDNSDRRFEPANKEGVFRSIEDRQGIDIQLGVRLPNGSIEYKGVGRFFQYSGGWRTGNNGLTIQWDMVDIIGLLADRQYIAPTTLPTTLSGWVASIVRQLGSNFDGFYTVDDGLSAAAVTVSDKSEISGMTCGEMLRHVCMAAGGWAHADAQTGRLAVTPLKNDGREITLDNAETYPTIKANADLAAIVFVLPDGTQYVVAGDAPSSNNTPFVSNPFVKTAAAAESAAGVIKESYGGNIFEVVWRGDPAAELGDVDVIEVGGGRTATGRVQSQTFQFSGGVLRSCQTSMIEVT